MNDAFQKDCLEILAAKVERGEISRRRFTQLAAMMLAGAPFALRAGARQRRRASSSFSSIGAAMR